MGNGGWSRLLHWWGGTILAATCAGAAFIAQAEAAESLSPWASWTIKLGGAGATVVGLLLPARQTWIEVRAREDAEQLAKAEVTNYQLAMRSVLLPLTDIFDQIITAPNETGRMEAKGAAKQAVVNSVVQFTNIPRARSCYFEYECSDQEKKLVCRTYAGRDSKPRTGFSSTNSDHAEVFKLLENRQTEFKQNIDQENSPRFPSDRDYNYKTYISVPVATSAEIFGLLTLDALHGDELLPQHEKEMLLLAQLLGIALAGNTSRADRHLSITNSAPVTGAQRPARQARSITGHDNSTA
jgi:transcriptional regulator with GAF, ATPase, and Fis domain